jgi:hypothetical protein
MNNYKFYSIEMWYTDIYGFSICNEFFLSLEQNVMKLLSIASTKNVEKYTLWEEKL